MLQLSLDVVGLIPGVGELADLVNLAISAKRRQFLDVGLGIVSLIPILGIIPGVGKIGIRLRRLKRAIDVLSGPLRRLFSGLAEAVSRIGRGARPSNIRDAIRKFREELQRVTEGVRDATKRQADEAASGADEAADTATRSGRAARDRGAWALNPLRRGEVLEQKLGKNTPKNMPFFDVWKPRSGEAVSIKTVDLERKIPDIRSDMRAAVREITDLPVKVEMKGRIVHGGVDIPLDKIKTKGLRVGIAPGATTDAHLEMFEQIRQYGEQQGLDFVEFIEVK